MENKPIVTCHGDQSLFAKLHPLIVQGLPRESVEWRRTYGRPVRQIYTEANFVPFNPGILPGDDDWTLLGRTFFHTYWTECDIDTYKASVKEDISEWINTLKEKNVPDWLIVVVVNEESKVKTKILRTSVFDKVKSDFCSKQHDRCVVLTEPLKTDIKTAESWGIMFMRLRHLLLLSYNRNLSRFEDHMRNERERRTEKGWSFFQYFMLQEELAFMYEMLGMYEDALVQYDELDALFTQFLLNHNAGDQAGWISDLAARDCQSWNGVLLSQPLNIEKRQLIKKNVASLLDFRDYLFSRQCTSLFLQFKPWEVAKRSIPFMHNCIKEIQMLGIKMPNGAMDCWIFLSCLEVLKTCEKFADSGHMDTYSLYTASLWDYARIKMREVGQKCSLMPDMDSPDSSDQVQGLVTGLRGSDKEEGSSEPVEKLKAALSSNESFYQYYLEYSELAMGTYKHIGRIRSARSIGMDLALFYMKLHEYQKAEGFLLDALKTFKEEGWDQLADNTRLHIAQCQKHLDLTEKYGKTCTHIAASKWLSEDIREHHQRELLRVGKKHEEEPFLLRLRTAFDVLKISPACKTFTMHKPCSVVVTLHSRFPLPVHCEVMAISIVYESPLLEHTATDPMTSRRRNVSGQSLKHHRRQSSTSSTQGIEFYNHVSESTRKVSQTLDLGVQTDVKHDTCGLICRSPLRRMDSGPKGFKEKDLIKEDFEKAFIATDLELKPGENVIELTGHLEEKGRYLLGQLCVKVTSLEFLKTFIPDYITFNLVCDDPSMSLQPLHTPVVTGIPQEITLTLSTGSHILKEGSKVILTTSPALSIRGSGVENGTLELPSTQEYEDVKFNLWVFADVALDGNNEDAKYEFNAELDDVGGSFQFHMEFINPFTVSHKLLTSGRKKFIQLLIEGSHESTFEISHHALTSSSADVELSLLNQPDQILHVDMKQSASYVWQLNSNQADCQPLDLKFSFTYKLLKCEDLDLDSHGIQPKVTSYSFQLENYSTLFAVKSEVKSPENEIFCSMGNPYELQVIVKDVRMGDSSPDEEFLMYEVQADGTLWALSGKTSGAFQLVDKTFRTCIEATPLAGGNLPLPIIKLLKYLPNAPDMKSSPASREEFHSGQVYNCSLATHVYVVPNSNLTPIDITVPSLA